MKTLINNFVGFSTILILLIGCKKEVELPTLQAVSFPAGVTANVSNITLSEANGKTSVVTFTWPTVTYPVAAPVTYTLQIDVPADTIGSASWGNAKSIEVGSDVLTKSILGDQLNTMVLSLGLEAGKSGTIVVRAKSFLDRPVYSKAVTIQVMPYKIFTGYPSIWVPGDYQGWNPGSAPKIVSVKSNKLYEGYIYIPAGGSGDFKFTAQPDWTPMAYGDGVNGVLIEANYAGGNFHAEPNGYYNLTADLATMKYSITKTTWSIIGDATPGGWGGDTQMAYDPAKKVWTVTANMLSTGSFKFRANNDWKIDFGVNKAGKLLYADHPVLGYTADLDNLSVPSSGNYTITLDLSDPSNYSYKLVKN